MELRQDWPQQEEDGGNQSSGVSDSDPPDEVDDGESPADGDIYAPDSNPANEEIADGVEQAHGDQEGEAESNEPSVGCGASEHDGADFVRDRGEGVPGLDYRRGLSLLVHGSTNVPAPDWDCVSPLNKWFGAGYLDPQEGRNFANWLSALKPCCWDR